MNTEQSPKLAKPRSARRRTPSPEHLQSALDSRNIVPSSLGEIVISTRLGAGGNGAVYAAELHGTRVAVKFLVAGSEPARLTRFRAEYWNTIQLPENQYVCRALHYQECLLNGVSYPMIVMRRYNGALDRPADSPPSYEDLNRFFGFLTDSLEYIHEQGIIHRDLKPDNILINGKSFVLADFGIADYHPEKFSLQATTREDERVANFAFSAPEQATKGILAHVTMDIYTLGQICQWYVTGSINHGTDREKLTKSIPEALIIDEVVEKCLANSPEKRFQSIKEIKDYIRLRNSKPPVHYLESFRQTLAASFPNEMDRVKYVLDKHEIVRLMDNLAQAECNDHLRWCDGPHQASARVQSIDEDTWLIGIHELRVAAVIIYTDPRRNCDFVLIVTKGMKPFQGRPQLNQTEDAAAWYQDRYITTGEWESRHE
ncbi:MAG: protein kinase, partial [Candidatus Kapaibacterium sp.]